VSVGLLQRDRQCHGRIQHQPRHGRLPTTFVAKRPYFRVRQVDASSRQLFAQGEQPCDRRPRGSSVVPTLGNEACHRLAMPGDDDLFAALHTIEQFGQPGLGVVSPDRHGSL
jgi:hypothetical protein